MNVTELWALTEWVEREIKAAGVVNAYDALRDITRQNTSSGNQQPIEQQCSNLINSVRAVKTESISMEQLDFLDRVGIAPFIGERAVDWIEDVTYKNAVDQAHIAAEMERAITAINEGLRRIDAIRSGLEGLMPSTAADLLRTPRFFG